MGDFLHLSRQPVHVSDPANALLISVRLHGQGAVRRSVGDGKAPKAFTGNRGRTGQFVFSRIWARRGAMALIPDDLDGVVVTSEFPLFDLDTNLVHPRYLHRLVQSPSFLRQLDQISAGASGQNRVREAAFLRLRVSLPSLTDQRRIAAILDQADALQCKRRRVLELLNVLTQSIFRDMFGDPISNPLGLDRASLGSIARVLTGNSPSRANAENFGNAIDWIKSDNLGDDIAARASERLSELGRSRARIARKGSVLVTCIAGSRTSIGKASVVDRDVAFNQQINAVLPSASFDSHFLLAQFKVAPELVRAKSTGGMTGLVNKSSFEGIEVLLPPLPHQKLFAERAAALLASRSLHERAIAAGNELFASLQSSAFRGEL